MEHRFFGLGFEIDRPIAGLKPTPGHLPSPIRVSFLQSAASDFENIEWVSLYQSAEVDIEGRPMLVIDRRPDGKWLRMRYRDGTTFILDRNASEVFAWWTPPLTAEDAATYLVAPVFGLLLYLRGLTCLHASAIAHQGKALVFVGAAEAGKSTLAAAFARTNHRVLSDDILVLERADDGFVARPGIPRIGLWPDSVEYLWGDRDALPRQVATWDKRHLDLRDVNLFQEGPLPIGAVYILVDRTPQAAPRIEALRGAEAVLALIANKYVTRISEREQNRRDFVLLSELAASIPVRRITRSDALSDLEATCEAIVADYASLALAPA